LRRSIRPNDTYNNASFVGNGSHHLPPHPNQQFSPLPSPHNQEFPSHNQEFDHFVHRSPHQYSSTTRTPDSEIAPDNTSPTTGPSLSHAPHQHIPSWYQPVPSPTGSGTVNTVLHSVSPGYGSYFPNSPAIGDVQQQAAGAAAYEML
jgi:hypothetical protein